MFLIFWFLNAGIARTASPAPMEAAGASSRIFEDHEFNQISENVYSEKQKRFKHNYTHIHNTYRELFPRKHEKFYENRNNYRIISKDRLPRIPGDRHILRNTLSTENTKYNAEKRGQKTNHIIFFSSV